MMLVTRSHNPVYWLYEQFACTTAEEVEKWISAFRHAKEEVQAVSIGSGITVSDFRSDGL